MKELKVIFQPSGRTVHVLPGTLLLEAAGVAGIVLQTPCGGKGTCGKCRVVIEGEDVLACQSFVDRDQVVTIPEASMFETNQRILEHDSGASPAQWNPRVSSDGSLGVAFDMGTTTVVGTLFSMKDGAELAVESALNGQISFGDDVIARIQSVCEDPTALAALKSGILDTVNSIIRELCSKAGVDSAQVKDVVIAGNSTMQQIFCGMDVSALGSIPFEQAFHEAQLFQASELGVLGADDAEVYVFPQVDGFVGGDTVSGMVATRLDQCEGPTLLIDIGTNGEIVLSAGGRLLTCSTAAGPAFEGARIKQGMRATAGAIEKIIINETVHYNVIQDVKPAGICGSALIDAVAGLLDAGVVDETGRILQGDEIPDSVADDLKDRVMEENGQTAFVLVHGVDASTGRSICLWQKDIRELQLASGAIRAGISIMMNMAGITAGDLDRVLLAGAFGNFIRRNHAVRIGLLPQISYDRVRFIGNAASLGAKLALLSMGERKYAEELRKKSEHVDLSKDASFQMEFSMAMLFPERDGC